MDLPGTKGWQILYLREHKYRPQALTELLGINITVNRKTITMQIGDEALVFRLVFPPGTPRICPEDKGALSKMLLDENYELG